jgi:hypothetical protein
METKQTYNKQQNFYVLKKTISIIFFLLLFYALPLAGKPQLLLNWHVILLAIVCTILYATQPGLSLKEAQSKKAADKNTMPLILLVSSAGQIISLSDWA